MDFSLSLALGLSPLLLKTNWVLNFNGVNYAELSEPKVLLGDFEIELDFSTKEAGKLYRLVGMYNTSDSTKYDLRWTGNADVFQFYSANGSMTDNPNNVGVNPADGKLHTLKYHYSVSEGLMYSYIDGILMGAKSYTASPVENVEIRLVGKAVNTTAGQLEGTLPSLKITDLVDSSNSVSWKLNSGKPVYTTDANQLTNNQGDWTENTYSGSGTLDVVGDVVQMNITDGDFRARNDTTVTLMQSKTFVARITVHEYSVTNPLWSLVAIFDGDGNPFIDISGIGVHETLITGDATIDRVQVYRADGGSPLGILDAKFTVEILPYISTISEGTVYELPEGGAIGNSLVDVTTDVVGNQDGNISHTQSPAGIEITAIGASGYCYISFPTKIGSLYLVDASYSLGANATDIFLQVRDGDNGSFNKDLFAKSQEFFVAKDTTSTVRFGMVKSATPAVITYDYINVREVTKALKYINVTPTDWSEV